MMQLTTATLLPAQMTPAQIAEAQRLAREWKPVGPGASPGT
jgi:hypothetical protein